MRQVRLPTVLMRKLRLRDGKVFVQEHITGKRWSQGFISGTLIPESTGLISSSLPKHPHFLQLCLVGCLKIPPCWPWTALVYTYVPAELQAAFPFITLDDTFGVILDIVKPRPHPCASHPHTHPLPHFL